jgi:hypothetical protein
LYRDAVIFYNDIITRPNGVKPRAEDLVAEFYRADQTTQGGVYFEPNFNDALQKCVERYLSGRVEAISDPPSDCLRETQEVDDQGRGLWLCSVTEKYYYFESYRYYLYDGARSPKATPKGQAAFDSSCIFCWQPMSDGTYRKVDASKCKSEKNDPRSSYTEELLYFQSSKPRDELERDFSWTIYVEYYCAKKSDGSFEDLNVKKIEEEARSSISSSGTFATYMLGPSYMLGPECACYVNGIQHFFSVCARGMIPGNTAMDGSSRSLYQNSEGHWCAEIGYFGDYQNPNRSYLYRGPMAHL